MNKMKMLRLCMFSGLILILIGCDKNADEEVIEPARFRNVATELVPYFERFEAEAAKRGMKVDLSSANIRGEIKEIEERHVAGRCSYSRFNNPRLVTIDESFWNRSSVLFKEFIVFHELGHCFLDRGHLETAFSNGVCVSIMRSGVGDCFDNYRQSTREGYIDELFEPGLLP